MSTLKKRQHYVWRSYLKPWTENNSLFCLREGRIFKSNLMNLAQERFFYKLKELTNTEIEILIGLIKLSENPELRSLNYGWINVFSRVFKIRELLRDQQISNQDAEARIIELIHNFEEDFHAKIETSSKQFLEALYKKDTSFYRRDEETVDFLFFICQQYFRTRNMRSRMSRINVPENCNIDSIWSLYKHIAATSVSFSLYCDRAKFHLVLLENYSQIPFVTGDQPIVNTFAEGLPLNDAPDELELYYPLTPTLALLLTSNSDLETGSPLLLNEEKAAKYNDLIFSMSEQQVYSSDKSALKLLIGG